jgi:peptidylprolyl isomerase
MASQRGQRIGIWIIAIVLTVGTIGSFVVIVLSNSNQKIDDQQAATQQAAAQAQQTQAAQANADNSVPFGSYSAAAFDPTSITALGVQTLVEGTGATIAATDSINASYFGWTSDGKIFDSSQKKNTADAPITFPLNQVIQGWSQGLTGVKVGSTVQLNIPAGLAYGPTGSGIIPANAPLEFIVQIHSIDNSASASQ